MSGFKVTDFDVTWKGFNSWVVMPYIKIFLRGFNFRPPPPMKWPKINTAKNIPYYMSSLTT